MLDTPASRLLQVRVAAAAAAAAADVTQAITYTSKVTM